MNIRQLGSRGSRIIAVALAARRSGIRSRAESEKLSREPLGQWLVQKMPRGTNLKVPDRSGSSRREVPFADWDDDDGVDESDR